MRGTHPSAPVSSPQDPLPMQVIEVLGREQRGLDRPFSSWFRVVVPQSYPSGETESPSSGWSGGVWRHFLRAQAAKQNWKYNPATQVLAMQTAQRAWLSRHRWPPLPALH